MKKLLSILLLLVLLFTFAACSNTPTRRLSTPQNVTVVNGLISWSAVENAQSYTVIIDGNKHTTDQTYYISNGTNDFSCQVIANGEGYYDSLPSQVVNYVVQKTKLATPTNVKVNYNGKISWDAVPNATGYVVTVNGQPTQVSQTYLEVGNTKDFVATVVAVAAGYLDSDASERKVYTATNAPTVSPDEQITIAISGASQLYSGKSAQLVATVEGTTNKSVTWTVDEGADFVSIDQNGVITAQVVDGTKIVSVTATSMADNTVSATKVLELVAKTQLTQDMIDKIASTEKIAFEGYVSIDLFEFDAEIYYDPDKKGSNLYMTSTTSIKTAMNGVNWYSQYEVDYVKQNMYVKNDQGYATQVGVSLTNDEEYFPMLDNRGEKIGWEQSGYYNVFRHFREQGKLTISDFTFDETTWRWKYTGADNSFNKLLLASCNPYDFTPKDVWLIIDNNEIMGIYSQSEDDFSLATGYYGVQNLYVAVDTNQNVQVPTISKYTHEDIHDDLATAIANMQNLTSYTTNIRQIGANVYTSGYVFDGYEEIVTANDCYFVPYTFTMTSAGDYVYDFNENGSYGYHKVNDNLYNSYYNVGTGHYQASRAYAKDFKNAKPSFEFAAEIFRTYYENPDDGSVTYYVDDVMTGVASTFYYGLGNDIALYGIYASVGYTEGTNFTPYVTIKDGYIVSAGFYYYLGYLYGIMEIEYSNFNNSAVPTTVTETLNNPSLYTVRQVPNSWTQVNIIQTQMDSSSSSTDDDQEVNADLLLRTYFNLSDSAIIPFFGDAIGDTYGFGMTSYHIGSSGSTARKSIQFYYDVPLDINYSIDSSLDALDVFLKELGFSRNVAGEYSKGITDMYGVSKTLWVHPLDNSLDLYIHVWMS